MYHTHAHHFAARVASRWMGTRIITGSALETVQQDGKDFKTSGEPCQGSSMRGMMMSKGVRSTLSTFLDSHVGHA